MPRCKYTVTYSGKIAKFSSYTDAHYFAEAQRDAEITEARGMVGQYINGVTTPEFAQHAREARNTTH